MNRPASFLLMLLSSFCLAQDPPAPSLLVHVGGTMRPAMEDLCTIFSQETGITVEVNYNDSGALMSSITQTGKGDLCVLHDPFPALMEKQGLTDRTVTVAGLTPVIVVAKANPKGLAGVADLAREGVKVGLTDAEYSTAGHIVPIIFAKAKIAETMARKEIVRTRSGGEIANAVKLGTVDAAIVWNAVAFARSEALTALPIPTSLLPDAQVDAVMSATYGRLDLSLTRVAVMVLKGSKHLDAARRLADLAGSVRGRAIFARRGFTHLPMALSGSLLIHCAAGVREPVSAIAGDFERQTGVKVHLTFANSGQLLGQIETTRKGDVYIPGDIGFVAQARSRKVTEDQGRPFCRFVPAILVRTGNPKSIQAVTDLARPGLKLALADASAAIGTMQAKVFAKNKMDETALTKNTVVSPATVTEVALAVKLGTVDAGMVWDALAGFAPDDTEIVRIPEAQNVIGTVAACVLTRASNRSAAESFLEFLAGAPGQTVLKAMGFAPIMPGP